ncbi:hypothetical protein PybrP1_005730 [[Pythium] brassicae (nom. inval.)]|nr:hypothetical protein PybrP1_005730 [[Pythium] brassicae (nom. inval.)]
MPRETLAEFDFSVRARLASSALCGGLREPSVALKLHLRREDADADAAERHVMLELDETQLARLLDACAAVAKELARET